MIKKIIFSSLIAVFSVSSLAEFGDYKETKDEKLQNIKKKELKDYNPNLIKLEERLNKFRFSDFGEIVDIEPVYDKSYYETPNKVCDYDQYVEIDEKSGLKMIKDKKHCQDIPKKNVKKYIKGYKVKFKYSYDGYIYTNKLPTSSKVKVRMEIDADKDIK